MMRMMVEKRDSTHTVECYDNFGEIVGFVAPASSRLIDAIFAPSVDRCAAEAITDVARAGDIYAEFLGILE